MVPPVESTATTGNCPSFAALQMVAPRHVATNIQIAFFRILFIRVEPQVLPLNRNFRVQRLTRASYASPALDTTNLPPMSFWTFESSEMPEMAGGFILQIRLISVERSRSLELGQGGAANAHPDFGLNRISRNGSDRCAGTGGARDRAAGAAGYRPASGKQRPGSKRPMGSRWQPIRRSGGRGCGRRGPFG